MTRKRFIKLLMSEGYSRDAVVLRADFLRGDRSYQKYYDSMRMERAIHGSMKQIRNLGSALRELVFAMGQCVRAIADLFSSPPMLALAKQAAQEKGETNA